MVVRMKPRVYLWAGSCSSCPTASSACPKPTQRSAGLMGIESAEGGAGAKYVCGTRAGRVTAPGYAALWNKCLLNFRFLFQMNEFEEKQAQRRTEGFGGLWKACNVE